MKNGIENFRKEFSIADVIWLETSLLCNNTFVLCCMDVMDIGYNEPIVWMIHLNFVLYHLGSRSCPTCIRSWWLQWTEDYSGTTGTDWRWWCRTEHSVLHLGLKLRDVISMWQADLELELELSFPMILCTEERGTVHVEWITSFLMSYAFTTRRFVKRNALVHWLFTFGWEPVWLRTFGSVWCFYQ